MILSSFSNIPSSLIISFMKFQNFCGTVASLLFFLLPAVPRSRFMTCHLRFAFAFDQNAKRGGGKHNFLWERDCVFSRPILPANINKLVARSLMEVNCTSASVRDVKKQCREIIQHIIANRSLQAENSKWLLCYREVPSRLQGKLPRLERSTCTVA